MRTPSKVSLPIAERASLPEFVAMHDADGKHVSYALKGQEHLHVGLRKGDGMNVPEVVSKPKPNLPLKVEAFWNPAEARLELQMELLPVSELSHHQLAAMFDKNVESSCQSTNVNDVLKVKLTFQHDKDVAMAGKLVHDEHLAARAKDMHIDQYREWKAAEDKKATDAKRAADKAAKKADAPN